MENYILFKNYRSFMPECILMSAGGMVKYRKSSGESQDFYVVTPEFTIIDVIHDQSQCSILVSFNSDDDFLRMLDQIDGILLQLHAAKTGGDINTLVRSFRSSRVMDPVSLQMRLLELKISVVGGRPTTKLFDEFSYPIGLGVLTPGFRGSAVMRPKGLTRENSTSVSWIVEQIKVTIPETHFGQCMLNDDNEDLELQII